MTMCFYIKIILRIVVFEFHSAQKSVGFRLQDVQPCSMHIVLSTRLARIFSICCYCTLFP